MSKSKKSGPVPLKRRRYNAEFKAEAVQLLRDRQGEGVSLSEVARALGITHGLLWQWAHAGDESSAKRGTEKATGETLEQEVRRLRREVALLKQERDFAKKAAAYFARESP
jgi:transposase